MANEIQAFENAQFGIIRAQNMDGEPWFVAKDVCNALSIKNSRDALSRLDDDEKGVASTDTLGGEQQVQTVNEAGLYTSASAARTTTCPPSARWRWGCSASRSARSRTRTAPSESPAHPW